MHLSTLPAQLRKPLALSLLSAAVGAALALTARAETHVSLNLNLGIPAPILVREAPPRPTIVEAQYAAPGPGFVWIAGHNAWMNGRWVWVAGTWARPPQPGAVYVEGRWDERSRNWTESHWEVVEHRDDRGDRHDDHGDRHDDRWDREHRGPGGVEMIVQAPPPPRHEHRGHRPGDDYVWIDGYWAWRGNHHEWVEGRWDRPPHGRHEWIAPRWEHRGGSYVFIEGSWR